MMAAIKKAEERGCEIALIDRPIQVTMQRFWSAMKFTEKIKMIFSIIFAVGSMKGIKDAGEEGIGIEIEKGEGKNYIELDRITDDDVVTQLMGELREFSPGAATALLDERDAYIAGNLRELELHAISKEETSADAGAAEEEEGRKIVAVVGAGHVAGIKNLLEHPELIQPKEELISLPKKRLFGIKNLLGVGLGAALLIILLAVIFSGILTFQDLLRVSPYWIVINGVLSAAGVVIARGHPLSALTAFCASPITSLIPFLAAGWFNEKQAV
jgi:pheromone shutdown-related protein TraB